MPAKHIFFFFFFPVNGGSHLEFSFPPPPFPFYHSGSDPPSLFSPLKAGQLVSIAAALLLPSGTGPSPSFPLSPSLFPDPLEPRQFFFFFFSSLFEKFNGPPAIFSFFLFPLRSGQHTAPPLSPFYVLFPVDKKTLYYAPPPFFPPFLPQSAEILKGDKSRSSPPSFFLFPCGPSKKQAAELDFFFSFPSIMGQENR